MRSEFLGRSIDFGDFIIIRPKKNYRINSNLLIIKDDEHPVVIDSGTPLDPGKKRIIDAFDTHSIRRESVRDIFLTHSHPDHFSFLAGLRNILPNAKVITHRNEFDDIHNPRSQVSHWVKVVELTRPNHIAPLMYNLLAIPSVMLFYRTYTIFPKIDITTKASLNTDHMSQEFSSGNLHLKIIPTFGHTSGHCSLLDNHKNIYLGDCVPFTPWVNISAKALDDMIFAVKHLITYSEKEIKYSVRSHGDTRHPDHKSWEVSLWGDEKERFKKFLNTIETSLERIPLLIRKSPSGLGLLDLANILIPQYRKYSVFVRYFVPPSLTWIAAYVLKLEDQGLIQRASKRKKVMWIN